ncbi:MAG: hypothetical protein AB9836_07660 [Aminipila sp.]
MNLQLTPSFFITIVAMVPIVTREPTFAMAAPATMAMAAATTVTTTAAAST